MIRSLKIIVPLCVVGLGLFASAPASAQYWHGRARVGVYWGVPVHAPYYYPPHYYAYPPAVYVPPAEPLVYVERGDGPAPAQSVPQSVAPSAQAEPSASSDWYYCANTGAYYPYVQTCASPWQRVSPQPPSASR